MDPSRTTSPVASVVSLPDSALVAQLTWALDVQGTNVTIGRDTTIGVGVQIYGSTVIGQRARVEGPTTILDSSIEDDVYIRSFSVLEGAHVSSGSGAGPFARLREGTQIGPSSYVGNFVETKNARIGRNTLACHLTYLGDADVSPIAPMCSTQASATQQSALTTLPCSPMLIC